MMELPTAQEKVEQIFLLQPKVHQFKFAETRKAVPADPLWLVAFFKQCQTATKVASLLDKLKENKQQRRRKWPILLSLPAKVQTTGICITMKERSGIVNEKGVGLKRGLKSEH
jgi:hypothetical protein